MIIVTGSRGFIGSYFKKKLKNVFEVDIHNKEYLLEAFDRWEEVELVIHNGAISDTTETDANKIYKFNIEFTLKLIDKCRQYNTPIKYASSASVYGNSKDYSIQPLNLYALSKSIIDECFVREKWKNVQGFRYYNVYGNGESHKGSQASPITQFTKQARDTGVIKIFEGSENYIRDFICVEDIFNVVMGCKEDGIFDIGTSEPISFLEVAELVAEKENANIEIIPFPEHLKDKYQFYTKAKKEFSYPFNTVKHWLMNNDIK